MSEENEIRDGIDDEITTATKLILTIIFTIFTTITGMGLGAVIGFYGFLYSGVLMGDGFVQGGWPLLIFTVPIGMLAGGGLGCSIPILFYVKWK